MANGQHRCVIASSNRFNDIKPYCSWLFRNDPQVWGSVFPWEFPQHAPREVEEDFLRRFFDETTIHMQGGAGTPEIPGNGFRFLKQVWYGCALWNLEHRVPAVEKWYLAQPYVIELLEDPKMKNFFLRDDVEPKTFFSSADLLMYGEKFLRVVIIGIQKTAREKSEEKEDGQHATDSLSVNIPLEKTLTAMSDQPSIKSAPPAQQEHLRPTNPDQAEFASRRATLSSRDKPEHVPVPPSTKNAVPQAIDTPRAAVVVPPDRDMPPYSRKRVNSTTKRFNNRGGQYPTRQPHQFAERDRTQHPFPLNFYNPHAAPGHPHGPSGPSMEYMRNMSQGQPPMQMPNHLQYVPGQFGQPGMMQPLGMQQQTPFPSHQQPIYINHNNFPPPDNNQFPQPHFGGGSRSSGYDDGNTNRGGHRRPSLGQSSRGGKSRGANSLRGRGRGRDSFTSSDDHPAFPPGMGHGPRYSNDHGGASFNANHKGRRSSVFQEKNWRSNTDHPQDRTSEPFMKENFDPALSFQGSGRKHAPIGPPQHQGQFDAAYQPNSEAMRSFQVERTDSAGPNRGPDVDHGMSADANLKQPAEVTCDKDRIGAGCTAVKKLVLFNVPPSIPTEDLKDMFSLRVPVVGVTRNPPSKIHLGADPLVWVHFDHHDFARQFFETKPATWLDSRPFRCEVPKEYWDPEWKHYKGPVETVMHSIGPFRGPLQNAPGLTPPTVLRRTGESASSIPAAPDQTGTSAEDDRSADTTPTPSGANTPKKKNNNKSKKTKAKQPEDLRKISLTASADLKQSADQGGAMSDTNSTKSTAALGHDGRVDQHASIEYHAGSEAVQKQRSESVQTDVQSAIDPPFAPVQGIQTRLPQLGDNTPVSTAGLATVPEAQSTNDVKVQPDPQPETFRASREDEAKESQTQTENLENDAITEVTKTPTPPAAATETPSKADESIVDDSFHTASGSPDSIGAGGGHHDRGAEPSMPTKTEQVGEKLVDDSESVPAVEPGSPTLTDETVSPKTVKKVPIPDLSAKPKVTISTAELDAKPTESQSDQRSTSGGTIVPQTPAFVTAPNTPAVGHELSAGEESTDEETEVPWSSEKKVKPRSSEMKVTPRSSEMKVLPRSSEMKVAKADKTEKTDKEKTEKADKDKAEEAEKDKADKAEKDKIEKAKGPAQTQSFSLYGKKNEKKDKKGRKGTVKGKPASRAASQSSTRAVSRATTPSIDTSSETQKSRRGSKQGGDEMVRQDSKFPAAGNEQQAAQESSNAGKDDTSITQHESPSKRGKLSNLFSGIFGGGQQSQPSSNKPRTNSTPSAKNWLTKSKAPDRRPSIETPLNDHRTSGGAVDIDRAEHLVASEETKSTTSTASAIESTSTLVNDSFINDTTVCSITEHASGSALGLGISNATEQQSVQAGTGPKKKAKPKKRKNDSTSDRDRLQIDTEFSPEVGRKGVNDIFHFGDDSSPQVKSQGDDCGAKVKNQDDGGSPQLKNQGDDRSDASSQTMGADMLSSDLPSPQSARKLPPRPLGSGHLMEAKEPAWKKMKQLRRAMLDSAADSNTEEASKTVGGSSDGSEQDSQTDDTVQPSNHTPGPQMIVVYQYVGAPLRDDIDDETPEPDQSKENLRRLAAEGIRRKRKDGMPLAHGTG